MNTDSPDISVITINYNSSAYTIDCVRSIIKHTPDVLNYNIIVVDNNSAVEDFNKLSVLSEDSQVRVVKSNINLGFSGGNMLGVRQSSPKYYFFLNNDCLLLNDSLSVLLDFCNDHADVALCSPQLYSEGMHPQSSFDYFPTLSSKLLGTGILRLFKPGKFPRKHANRTEPFAVDVVSGSAMFVRAEAFDRVGGFDTRYFLYCEEEDLALTLSRQGYETFVIPTAKVQHFEGGSTERSLEIEKEFYISYLQFYRKHFGGFKTQILKTYLVIKLLKRSFKDPKKRQLATFVMSGADSSHSLRHRQDSTVDPGNPP
jgi:GT2 family glycosyltransferase